MARNTRRLTLDNLGQAKRHIAETSVICITTLTPYFERWPDFEQAVAMIVESNKQIDIIIDRIIASI